MLGLVNKIFIIVSHAAGGVVVDADEEGISVAVVIMKVVFLLADLACKGSA